MQVKGCFEQQQQTKQVQACVYGKFNLQLLKLSFDFLHFKLNFQTQISSHVELQQYEIF